VLLRKAFEAAHGTPGASALRCRRSSVSKGAAPGRVVRFRGLAPEAETLSVHADLNAVWRSKHGLRFQNYRAKFCVLNAPDVPREWIDDVATGRIFNRRQQLPGHLT
jgi:Restriction endonuclease AspBHI N-terminal